MTLKDLLNAGLIKDQDNITITKPVDADSNLVAVIRGHWFEDHILDRMSDNILSYKWSPRGYKVVLEYGDSEER